MTTTIITTNTIAVGTAFTFAGSGDTLVVLPNVTLGSTAGLAVSIPFSDVEIAVMCTLVSVSQVVLTLNSSFTLTGSGTYVSLQPFSGNASLYMNAGFGTTQIDGTLVAQEALGILCDGSNNAISVTGSVTGGAAGCSWAFRHRQTTAWSILAASGQAQQPMRPTPAGSTTASKPKATMVGLPA